MAEQDYGDPTNWSLIGSHSPQGADNLLNILTPYMKTVRICLSGDLTCFNPAGIISLDGVAVGWNTQLANAVLSDGVVLTMLAASNDCSVIYGTSEAEQQVCAIITAYTGTKSKQPQFGRSYFRFLLTKQGIVPDGMPSSTKYTFVQNCTLTNEVQQNGFGCTAWVLYNENMDYLRCNDLNWGTKKKCD